jgi:hypothetical protein
MPQLSALDYLMDDLSGFITKQYTLELPNSLLIAQAFILRYPEYGKAYGLPIINGAIEDGIKQGLF